jgi:transcriptional regulator with XRE-family HTH domain
MTRPDSEGRKHPGRKEIPITGTGPVADFARDLRALRDKAGLYNQKLAKRANYSPSYISAALNGQQMPPVTIIKAIVMACGGNAEEWEQRWHTLMFPSPPSPDLLQDHDPSPLTTAPAPEGRRKKRCRWRAWIRRVLHVAGILTGRQAVLADGESKPASG